MTVYADYSDYTTYLSGKDAELTAAEFPYYARKASAEITRCTFGNIPADNIPEEVSFCCCELAEILHGEDSSKVAANSGVSSESVGGWSVSYADRNARLQAHTAAVRDCIKSWLSETGLLYSGVR